MTDRRNPGALETAVLVRLWASDRPLSAAEVRASMGDDLAATTVVTVLNRLWHKGVVDRAAQGRAYFYRPLVSEADLTARRMRAQLERTADLEGALASFASSLSKKEARALRRVLNRIEGEH